MSGHNHLTRVLAPCGTNTVRRGSYFGPDSCIFCPTGGSILHPKLNRFRTMIHTVRGECWYMMGDTESMSYMRSSVIAYSII